MNGEYLKVYRFRVHVTAGKRTQSLLWQQTFGQDKKRVVSFRA